MNSLQKATHLTRITKSTHHRKISDHAKNVSTVTKKHKETYRTPSHNNWKLRSKMSSLRPSTLIVTNFTEKFPVAKQPFSTVTTMTKETTISEPTIETEADETELLGRPIQLFQQGRTQEALDSLEKCLSHIISQQNFPTFAFTGMDDLLRDISHFYLRCLDTTSQLGRMTQFEVSVMKIAEKHSDHELKALWMRYLGEFHFDSGNYGDSEKHFIGTLEIFKTKLAPKRLTSRSSHLIEEVLQLPALNGLTAIYLKQNQHDQSEKHAKDAIEVAVVLAAKLDQPKLLLEPYEQCGVLYYKLKKYKEAKEMYTKALNILDRMEASDEATKKAQERLNSRLTQTNFMLGEFEEMKNSIETYLGVKSQQEKPSVKTALDFIKLGMSFSLSGQIEKALKHLRFGRQMALDLKANEVANDADKFISSKLHDSPRVN